MRGGLAAWWRLGVCACLSHLIRLRLHYEALAVEKYGHIACRTRGNILGSVAHAHRKKLNVKLVLPNAVKDILKSPRDEISPAKLELLCAAIRHEVEGQTLVHLHTRLEIECLAKSVENCTTGCADEVGEIDESMARVAPAGARVMVDVPGHFPLEARRNVVAGLVRSMQEGDAVLIKMRPMNTKLKPPLDAFARELMRQPYRPFRGLAGNRPIEEMRDRLLLCPHLGLAWCA